MAASMCCVLRFDLRFHCRLLCVLQCPPTDPHCPAQVQSLEAFPSFLTHHLGDCVWVSGAKGADVAELRPFDGCAGWDMACKEPWVGAEMRACALMPLHVAGCCA